jgi:hypothetical protein
MIISDSWLQADYGLSFASYLLDNYKIKAVLDFSSRLFRIPLIGTLVLLLEECSEEAERNENKVVFAYVNKEASVEELLKVVEDPKAVSAFPRVLVKQRIT